MKRSVLHATKSAEKSSVSENSSKPNTENRRPQRCNRSVAKLKSGERLKKQRSKLHRQRLTASPRKPARMLKKIRKPKRR